MQNLGTNPANAAGSTSKRPRWLLVAAVIAIVFGIATIASGGFAIFGGETARAALGQSVPFIVWFNFTAGFAYTLAGLGLLMRSRWSVWLSALIAAATILAFLALGIHVLQGGAYEMRTVGAMALRSMIWTGIAIVAFRSLDRPGRPGAGSKPFADDRQEASS
jgi:hypothetical protein